MNVQIALEQPPGGVFTNLDWVRGRVILRLPKASQISHVNVKLEGEANSILQQEDSDGRMRDESEKHRILYKVARVFPPPQMVVDPRAKAAFVLQIGVYEYPFEFKLPFNNACESNNQHVGVWSRPGAHIKAPLPPSFTHGREAGVFYYIKATVNVPGIFRENPRVATFFHFSPIEPPRPTTDGECYARRQHIFSEEVELKKRKTFTDLMRRDSKPSPPPPTSPPVRFTIDARIPNPPVLTCGATVPLRILITQQTARQNPLFVQTLQVEIIASTFIRADNFQETKTTSWVLTSVSNLHLIIGNATDPPGTTTELDKSYWANYRLPDSICPTFNTCNFRRSYELVATLGLTYGSTQPGLDQFISLPLRHSVDIFSGIAPPPELLQRMAERKPNAPATMVAPPYTQVGASPMGAPQAGVPQSGVPLRPPGPPGYPGGTTEDFIEPPPSYEDAMADGSRPIVAQGPRDGYRPPAPRMDDVWADEKRR